MKSFMQAVSDKRFMYVLIFLNINQATDFMYPIFPWNQSYIHIYMICLFNKYIFVMHT